MTRVVFALFTLAALAMADPRPSVAETYRPWCADYGSSLLSDICNQALAHASARIAEYFRQFLDPVVSASGIEIKGLGRRLIRDAHAELDAIHALEKLNSPFIASSVAILEIGHRALSEARMDSPTAFYSASEP